MRLFGILLIVLTLSSCGNRNTASSNIVPDLDGEYLLVQLQGEDISSEDLKFTFNPHEDRVNGETGCNGFSARFLQKASKISVSQALSTRKYCEGKMDTEQEIFNTIERAAVIRKQGKELVFLTTEETPLFTLTKIE